MEQKRWKKEKWNRPKGTDGVDQEKWNEKKGNGKNEMGETEQKKSNENVDTIEYQVLRGNIVNRTTYCWYEWLNI